MRLIATRRVMAAARRPKVVAMSSASDYRANLAAAEASGDWIRAVELMTEARVLKLSLEPAAVEAAVRVCAASGQWRKAAEFSVPVLGTLSQETLMVRGCPAFWMRGSGRLEPARTAGADPVVRAERGSRGGCQGGRGVRLDGLGRPGHHQRRHPVGVPCSYPSSEVLPIDEPSIAG